MVHSVALVVEYSDNRLYCISVVSSGQRKACMLLIHKLISNHYVTCGHSQKNQKQCCKLNLVDTIQPLALISELCLMQEMARLDYNQDILVINTRCHKRKFGSLRPVQGYLLRGVILIPEALSIKRWNYTRRFYRWGINSKDEINQLP